MRQIFSRAERAPTQHIEARRGTLPQPLPDNIAAARDALGYDEVRWQPLTAMPFIAQLIDGMVEEGELRIQVFAAALDVLDDAEINDALLLHHERVHFIEIWFEQLRRWRNENPDTQQRGEIDRLQTQLDRLREINTQIFRLTAEVRQGDLGKSQPAATVH